MTAAVTSDAGYILVLGSTRRKLQGNGNLFCKYHWKMLSCLLPNFDSMTWTNWFPSADIYNVSIFGTFATRTALHMTSFSKYKSARFLVLLLFTTGPCWSCPQRSGWGRRWSSWSCISQWAGPLQSDQQLRIIQARVEMATCPQAKVRLAAMVTIATWSILTLSLWMFISACSPRYSLIFNLYLRWAEM